MSVSKRNSLTAILLLSASLLVFVTGCTRDPNVRKQKYLESGKRYFTKGKYREAAIQFSNALRIDSAFADAHYQLALCDLKLGSVQNAYIELSRTVQLQPDNLQAQLDLGDVLLVGRQADKAAERADYILSRDPGNVAAHVLKADANASLRQFDQAITEMNTAIQLDPKRSSSYLNLGVLEAAKAPDSAAAENDLKKAIDLDPKSIQPHLALGGMYDRGKRFNEAEQQLQEAIKLQPRNQTARTALVVHYLAAGQKDAAEKAAKEAKAALGDAGAQFLARYYLSVKDQKSATAEYQQLAQQFPKNRDIQHAYVDLLMAQGQNDAALKQVGGILKNFPKDNQAMTDKGLLLLEQHKASEARDVLQAAVKADPQNVVALFALGESFQALGDAGQAETEWREAARVQPAYLPAERALAQLAISKKDFSGLAQIAKTVLEKAPNAADGYQLQAEVDAANNDATSAKEHLEKAISLNPRNSLFYVQLGQLHMALHQYADAEKTLNEALQIDPQQTMALQGLAQIYLSEKQPQKAMQLAQDTVAKFPQNGRAHLILGELAVAQNNLELAEPELTKAAQQLPNDVSVYSNLGSVQVSRNEIPQAEATYQSAVRNNPKDPGAYWLLATIQEKEKKTADAEQNYRKALELRPDFGIAANNLAYLMMENGENIDQVITYAEIARRQMPNAPAVADTLGWAYYQKGTAGLAVEMLQDAVKAVPNSGTYHYHLGMAYSKSGDRQRAKTELQKAMQLENTDAQKAEIRKGLASLG